ncbi:MAG: YceI family protein [Pseudomonadota bacterium]
MGKQVFAALAGAAFMIGCGGAADAVDSAAAVADESGVPLWTVDADKSRLGFVASQNGAEFEGAFESFDAEIRFDPDNLEQSTIVVTVDMKSARTGDRQRDSALPGKDWFLAKEHPTAQFTSSSITKTGDGAYEAAGALTIRDTSKDIVLPFTLDIEGDQAEANGAVSVVRTDFGVGQGEFSSGKWVGLDVTINVAVSASR